MIQAFGLTSNPRKAHPPALDDVSFEAPAGHVTVLLGAPGAGKTTALRLMLELQQGRGITYFRGRPLHRIAHPAREVGVLLGDVPGHPARTVRGHLRMLCAAAGVPARRADQVLEVVGLVSLREERLGTLSRGMDRRFGLACALLSDPHTLVLDDPTQGLSAREGRWLHGVLRAHASQGGTVLLTTADPKEAARTADRVVTLESGRLVADQEAAGFARTRLRPRVAVRSPHAARLAALLTKEARAAQRSVEVVREEGNRLSVYGSTTAAVGEIAFRHGILVHQLADETGDMGPGAEAFPLNGHRTVGETAREERPEAVDEPPMASRPDVLADQVVPERSEVFEGPRVVGRPRNPEDALLMEWSEALGGAAGGARPRNPDDVPARERPTVHDDGLTADRPRKSGAPGEWPLVSGETAAADRPQPLQGGAESAQAHPAESRAADQPRAADGRSATDASPTAASTTLPGDTHSAGGPEADAYDGLTADSAAAARTTGDSPEPERATPPTAPSPVTAPPDRHTPAPAHSSQAPHAPQTPADAPQDAHAPTPAQAPDETQAPTATHPSHAPAATTGRAPRAASTHPRDADGAQHKAGSPRATEARTPDSLSPLPPPISVRPAPSPLRPLRYELRRAAGIGTGWGTSGAVLAVSALTAVLLARLGHTPQERLFAAWPAQLPLPPAALGAGLLGALSFGDEFRHPALAADRGTVPRRLGLLTAKLLVSGATALLLAFLTLGCDAEALYLVYGRELAQVPADWLSLSASWFGLVVGCAWAGVLAAGVFRSTTAGLAAVLAVPVVVVPLVQKALQRPGVRAAAGIQLRMREVFLLEWPFGGERYLAGVVRVVAQPVGGALSLSLTALLCAYVLTTLRSRVR
ncbi:ATP-binding cassette domain-containing protein [Streptomyces sp. NPDC005209]|uniref:ATP-binding cassette domain-containing protein n=1 Tax=Streptomyces sp. NPDC005209 TaxID=3156715 RepID=UPI0033ADD2E9